MMRIQLVMVRIPFFFCFFFLGGGVWGRSRKEKVLEPGRETEKMKPSDFGSFTSRFF